jgi:hypothetical protein
MTPRHFAAGLLCTSRLVDQASERERLLGSTSRALQMVVRRAVQPPTTPNGGNIMTDLARDQQPQGFIFRPQVD